MHVTKASAGYTTSLVLTDSGEMWSWGKGPALGHGGGVDSRQLVPKVIEGLPPGAPILRIAAGGSAAAYVRADGATFTWGKLQLADPGVTTPTHLG